MEDKINSDRTEICGGVIRGETLELGTHYTPNIIHNRAFFQNCVLNIWSTNFSIIDANFLNCRINAQKEVSNMRFLEAVFERCVFEGCYVGCSFGHVRAESQTPNAYYRNCDFSKAALDLCEFFEGDLDSVVWPAWPNFVVINPRQNKQDWLSIQFPEQLKHMQSVIAGQSPAIGGSVSQMAPKAVAVNLANYEAVDTHSIRSLLDTKPYVKATT